MRSEDLIQSFIKADVPIWIWGPPGVGKTAAITASAKKAEAHLEVLIGSSIDPIDVGGYLLPMNGKVVSDPPPWAKRLRAALDRGQKAWLYLDELSCAPAAVQAALLRVANERRVGELDLSGVVMLAAANPPETATAEGEVGAAMSNRWAHVEYVPDPAKWCVGTLTNWGEPMTASTAGAASMVAAYITANPKALLDVGSGRAWPSPRSWSAFIRTIGVNNVDLKSVDTRTLAACCIGEAAGSEFYTFVQAQDLPNPEDMLSGRAGLPKRGDQLRAALQSLAAAALVDHPDRAARIGKAWEILAPHRYDTVLSAAQTLLDGGDGEVPDVANELGKKILSIRANSKN